MARRKKIKIPSSAVKVIFCWAFIFLFIFLILKGLNNFFLDSTYFRIKTINVDPALYFIDKGEFGHLKGKSMFTVNLSEVERKFALKYPQVIQLKIVKNFPDQITILAKKRIPSAQITIKGKTLVLDEDGMVVSTKPELEKTLPFIIGIKSNYSYPSVGFVFKGKEINTAMEIIQAFYDNHELSTYTIKRIDVKELSQISLYLSNELMIYMDRDNVKQELKLLGWVLSQNLDPQVIKYVDIRFKQPIIAKKEK